MASTGIGEKDCVCNACKQKFQKKNNNPSYQLDIFNNVTWEKPDDIICIQSNYNLCDATDNLTLREKWNCSEVKKAFKLLQNTSDSDFHGDVPFCKKHYNYMY